LLGHYAHACVEDYACGSKRGRKAKGDDPAINDPTTAVQGA